jgi:hypothetical protein
MQEWINSVWRKYTVFKLKKECMLVLDDASSHKTKEVVEKLEKLNTQIVMIPGGLTSKL